MLPISVKPTPSIRSVKVIKIKILRDDIRNDLNAPHRARKRWDAFCKSIHLAVEVHRVRQHWHKFTIEHRRTCNHSIAGSIFTTGKTIMYSVANAIISYIVSGFLTEHTLGIANHLACRRISRS